jgi:hypothetical protein
MTEGPFKSAFDADIKGVVRREIVTYRKLPNGNMSKEVTVRDYYESGDYHDSQTTLILTK